MLDNELFTIFWWEWGNKSATKLIRLTVTYKYGDIVIAIWRDYRDVGDDEEYEAIVVDPKRGKRKQDGIMWTEKLDKLNKNVDGK